MNEIAWYPKPLTACATRVGQFMRMHGISTVQALREKSAREPQWFWPAAMAQLGVVWDRPWTKLFDDSCGMPYTQWFVDGKLSIVRNCIDRHVPLNGKRIAFYWESETGERRPMTYRELARDVTRCATAMRESGIGKGDTIAMIMPLCPEAVIIMYAAMKIGAVPMQPAARLAPAKLAELVADAQAKIVFAADGYQYSGKIIDLRPTIHAIADHNPQIRTVVMQRIGFSRSLPEHGGEYFWADFMPRASGKVPADTLSLDAEDRALILFSSGTTGKPKAIVHACGGMLVNTAKELGLAFDCRTNDVFFWVTNLGWMMAPWMLIGVHFFGGTCVLYEGSPVHPSSHRVFEMIKRYRVTSFGFSPAGIRALDKTQDYSRYDLSSLRMLGSTGAPIDVETWWWYFRVFGKERCPIINIIGGTEIMGCLLSPLLIEPQTPAMVGGPALGMDVTLVDEDGNEVPLGNEGILVCRKPFPSMTRGFLDGYARFIDNYFGRWPRLWNHHDRARTDLDRRWYMCGRDDDLINRGGVKFDPVSIEDALRSFCRAPKVIDAVAVGVPDRRLGQKIVCFITVDDPTLVTEALRDALRKHVGAAYDPSGKPDEIHVVRALPMTLSSKKPYKLYVRAYMGEVILDAASYIHGEVFAEIKALGASKK